MKTHIDYEKEMEFRNWWLNNTGGTAAQGLTVRDYFAAKAMQGYMNDCYDLSHNERAENAYLQADAMMKERAK